MKHAIHALVVAVVAHAGLLVSDLPEPPHAAERASRTIATVTPFPAEANLTSATDIQSIVVQAQWTDGITNDVSDAAMIWVDNPNLVRVRGRTLIPRADGETVVRIAYKGHEVSMPVRVKNAGTERPVSFRLDVMAVLSKVGCNSGTCHGSASGKDGFGLSLFGFDPAGDYTRITREVPGRRVNLARPSDSLIVQKGLGKVAHTGGRLFEEGSEAHETMVRWLEAGAPDDPKDIPRVVGIDLMPKQAVIESGDVHNLTVRARYSDGTDRDVTNLTTFITSNETSASVDEKGTVTAKERGEAFLMARFDAFTVGSQFIVIPPDIAYEWPDIKPYNVIDELVFAKLQKLRMVPSGVCSDVEFLRRATIDITGRLPSADEFRAFVADPDPHKRAKLIDRLVEKKEFVELWVMKFAELLQIRSGGNQGISYKATVLYYNWLQEKLANNVPMNEIARELLSADGGTFRNPATNFYQLERDTKKLTENIAQVFMGMRIQCAQCHNHPFDRWTMDDYYGFVSFFSQIGRKRAEDPRETIVYNRGGGDVRHPVGNRVMAPKFLGGEVPDVKGKDRRKVLASWLASPKNPYFATNLSNIVWAHFMGRGVVDPVDDVRVSNPSVNPELLAELGKRFTDYGYDFKKLVKDICNSRTYQLETRTNASNDGDDKNFAHALVRRVRAEVLFDMISQVTETTGANKFRGLPKGARAVQIADGAVSSYFLTTFGRASRETVCSCEVKMEPNLSQALHLMNGTTVAQKVGNGGLVKKWIDEKWPTEKIIEELYIRCLTRTPTATEVERLVATVREASDPTEALADLFWAVLNSREFMFNH
ncbi:MAG: cell surface protein [Planctomycetes bacterium]|nr:cell surface protein [Planctomycetota bacterium]